MYNNTLQHVSLTEEENYDQCPNLIGLGALNPQRVTEVVRRGRGQLRFGQYLKICPPYLWIASLE